MKSTSILSVNIRLTYMFCYLQDVNDNAPVITVGQNSLSIQEDFVEFQINQGQAANLDFGITASDADQPVSTYDCIHTGFI